MYEVTYFICDLCGKQSCSKGAMRNHENACIRKVDEEKRVFEESQLIREEFIDSIETPEWIRTKTIEWMKEWNKIDLEIFEEDLRFSESVSNTHHCPFDGVTNWHGDPDLPRGYPGWTSHWIIGMDKRTFDKPPTFFSEYFDDRWHLYKGVHAVPRVNTGSGGMWSSPPEGTKEVYLHYYMYLFVDDFPQLKKWYERMSLKKELRR